MVPFYDTILNINLYNLVFGWSEHLYNTMYYIFLKLTFCFILLLTIMIITSRPGFRIWTGCSVVPIALCLVGQLCTELLGEVHGLVAADSVRTADGDRVRGLQVVPVVLMVVQRWQRWTLHAYYDRSRFLTNFTFFDNAGWLGIDRCSCCTSFFTLSKFSLLSN